MTMFAFMAHTHGLGSDVTGYMLHQGEVPKVEFARADPQNPQRFLEMENFLAVQKGDILGARCLFDGSRTNKTTFIQGVRKSLRILTPHFFLAWLEISRSYLVW